MCVLTYPLPLLTLTYPALQVLEDCFQVDGKLICQCLVHGNIHITFVKYLANTSLRNKREIGRSV